MSYAKCFAAIETAVNVVLSRPALMRHGYVKELVSRLFEDRHMLDAISEKIERFAELSNTHIDPTIYPYLVKLSFLKLELY